MINGNFANLREFKPVYPGLLGGMITPATGNSLVTVRAADVPWGCDNGCFPGRKTGGFDPPRFERMIGLVIGQPRLEWVCVPDYVVMTPDGPMGDARRTREMFDTWAPKMTGLPLAYVGQDGVSLDEVPWNQLSAVFLGGSTEWKLGPGAAAFATEAKRRGKWVHMGRVNSMKRIRYAHGLGCDSVDGTGTSRFGRVKIPIYCNALIDIQRQRDLPLKLEGTA